MMRLRRGKCSGSGAFSAVKLATNKKTGEKCAVKMVNKRHPEFTLESLVMECKFMKKVGKHRNIIEFKALYEFLQSQGVIGAAGERKKPDGHVAREVRIDERNIVHINGHSQQK